MALTWLLIALLGAGVSEARNFVARAPRVTVTTATFGNDIDLSTSSILQIDEVEFTVQGAALRAGNVRRSASGTQLTFHDGSAAWPLVLAGTGAVQLVTLAGGSTSYIQSTDLLQSATFFVSSGSVNGQFLAARTSGSVGIGTSSPGYFLDVSSSGPVGATVRISSSVILSDAGGRVGIGTASPSKLLHVGASGLVVTEAGEVGIGTINPTSLLSVAGTVDLTTIIGTSVTSLIVRANTSDANDTMRLILAAGGSNVSSRGPTIDLRGNENVEFEPGSMQITAGNTATGTVRIYTAADIERLTILQGGNVGVGTPTPSSLLDITGGSITVKGANAGIRVSSGTISLANMLTLRGADGHFDIGGSTPAISDCGTSPTVAGTDMIGKITVGTGGTASICNVRFATPWTLPPSCWCNDETQILFTRSSTTLNFLTCSVATAFAASDVVSYGCIGRQ